MHWKCLPINMKAVIIVKMIALIMVITFNQATEEITLNSQCNGCLSKLFLLQLKDLFTYLEAETDVHLRNEPPRC